MPGIYIDLDWIYSLFTKFIYFSPVTAEISNTFVSGVPVYFVSYLVNVSASFPYPYSAP